MNTKTICHCLAAVAFAFPTLPFAETGITELEVGFVADTGASSRIEAADALRTISQEVPAAVCHLHNGLADETAREMARDGLERFADLTDALLNGHEGLGIVGGEENLRARKMIEDLQLAWQPMHDATLAILANPEDTSATEIIYGQASAMMERSMEVLTKVESVHIIPSEMLYADAMLLDIAGRQAMMTQRLSFLACKRWSGASDADYVDILKSTTGQFAFAFRALQNGAPELGINPPPTTEIADALQAASADFDIILAKLEELNASGELDRTRAEDLYLLLAGNMKQMEDIAHLYALFSKRVY